MRLLCPFDSTKIETTRYCADKMLPGRDFDCDSGFSSTTKLEEFSPAGESGFAAESAGRWCGETRAAALEYD
jgi:hypothetical protein